MIEIAKIAGVSQGTVSNALNNRKGSLSKEKRNQILKIAEEMGYTKSKDHGLIRLVVVENEVLNKSNIYNSFFTEMLRGIQSECSENNFQLLISYTAINELDSIISSDKELNVAGSLILGTALKPEHVGLFEKFNLPYVIMDTSINGKKTDFVAIDNFNGMYEIASYLISMGHRVIGLANMVPPISNFKERRNGFIQSLQDHNLDFDPDYETHLNQNENMTLMLEDYFQRLDKLNKPYPTAIATMNDFIALEILSGLKQLDIDISITGFDNIDISKYTSPALTTIDVDKFFMGQSAVKRLLEKIAIQDSPHQRILISTNLIVRDSVKDISQSGT